MLWLCLQERRTSRKVDLSNSSDKTSFDLSFVSGARPDLMEKTLMSFQENCFSNIRIKRAYLNIDPIFGDHGAAMDCKRLFESYFPDALVFMPRIPSFGAAVKRLWMSTGDNHVLHLEDDWRLNFPIGRQDILSRLVGATGMVQLAIEDRDTYGGDFLYNFRRRRVMGYEIYSRKVNAYGTSPRFFRSGLLKAFGKLLKERYDPEKQVYKNKNWRLARAHMPWKCSILYGPGGAPLIEDLGRDWRSSRGIRKVDRHGKATWVSQ